MPTREHRRHDRGQAGRDRGDGEADPDEEEIVERFAANEPDQNDERQSRRGHDRDPDRQLVELTRKRRLLLLDLAQHPGDLSDLGRHPGRGHDHFAATARNGGVHVRHVDAVAERHVVAGHRLDRLQDRRALAREGRLLDLERRGHEQPPVRRDLVARLEGDDVPRNELLCRNVRRRSAAPHVRPDQEHLLERGDALGGLALLVQAQDGVEHRQAEDRETGRELLQSDDADDRGAEQDVLHEVAVLAQERMPARLLLAPPRACSARIARAACSISAASRPDAGSTPSCALTSSAVRPCQTSFRIAAGSGADSAVVSGVTVICCERPIPCRGRGSSPRTPWRRPILVFRHRFVWVQAAVTKGQPAV